MLLCYYWAMRATIRVYLGIFVIALIIFKKSTAQMKRILQVFKSKLFFFEILRQFGKIPAQMDEYLNCSLTLQYLCC